MSPKTLIAIPAYNEELTIGSVVVLSKKYNDISMINNGLISRIVGIAGKVSTPVLRYSAHLEDALMGELLFSLNFREGCL